MKGFYISVFSSIFEFQAKNAAIRPLIRSSYYIFFIFSAFVFQTNFSYAQAPVIEWQKTFGYINGDYAHSIKPTNDGGYIIAGYTEGQNGGDISGYHGNMGINDYWIVKIDHKGDMQWQKCLGGLYSETTPFIEQAADGGFIVAGSSTSINCDIKGNHGGLDYWIVKLKVNGDIEWQKNFGGSKHEYAWGVDVTSDGGYLIAGHSESTDGDVTGNQGDRDYWVVKIDGSGNLIWQKSLGGSGSDEAFSVAATNDGGCVVTGRTQSNNGDVSGNHGNNDYWVVKLGNSGNLQWQKCLGGTNSDEAFSIQTTQDGGYIVAGSAASNDGDVSGNHQPFGPSADYWVVKLSNNGNLQWQKCYGGHKNELGFYIKPTQDGGYVVAGSAESTDGDVTCNNGVVDMWLVKFNGTGNLEWQKSIGGKNSDIAYCAEPLNDGSFIVAGFTCSEDIPGFRPHNSWVGTCADFWIVKLSAPVSVMPAPEVTLNSGLVNICSGIETTLTTSVRYPGIKPVYRWERNGTTVGTNSPVYTASDFKNNDVVACYVTRSSDCGESIGQASQSVTIKVNSNFLQPSITITADNTTICGCSPATFTASVSNAGTSPIYQWFVNGLSTGELGKTYTTRLLSAGDLVTCTYSDTKSCIANGKVVSNALQMNAGTNQPVSASITSSSNEVCAGSTMTFTAATVNAGGNPTYQWKINGVNAGTNNKIFTSSSLAEGDKITCTVIPEQGNPCASGNSVLTNTIVAHIINKADPLVSITASSNTICTGSPATFTAEYRNAGNNPSFQWKVNDIIQSTGSNLFSLSGLNNGDIVSCSMLTDPTFACVNTTTANSNTISMTVLNQSAPKVTITVSNNNVCPGSIITFTTVVENTGLSPSYQWYVNNINQNTNLPVYSNNNLSNGDQVYCIITPGNGSCASSPVPSNKVVVAIAPAPGISITPVDTIIAPGEQVQFNTLMTGNIASYQWSPPGKLENPSLLSPRTTPLTDNTSYTLTAETDKGCKATKTVAVKILNGFYMPTAFTPNRDGKNDIFRIPPYVSLRLKEFSIYDRWGNKVFTTKDISKGWDGTFNQQELDNGAYVYFITGSDNDGDVFVKGTVMLTR